MPPSFGPEHTAPGLRLSSNVGKMILQARRHPDRSTTEADCEGVKLRGLDFGPCGSEILNSVIIVLILCAGTLLYSVLCSVLRRAREYRQGGDTESAGIPVQEGRRASQRHQEGRRRREQQAPIVQRRIRSASRNHSWQAQAVTDLSSQLGQLAQHFSDRRRQGELAPQDDEHRALATWTNRTELRTLEAARRRDRERDWEYYQRRSNQDILADILANINRSRSVADPNDTSREAHEDDTSLERFEPVDPLPVYSREDPLPIHEGAPPYRP
ncbi:MAG: hypothetical protein Q9174_002499 [Haloplaca sp. 1 TL-2023]